MENDSARTGIRLANFYFWYFAFVGIFGTYFALYLQSLGFSAEQIALLMSLQQFVRIVTPFFGAGWRITCIGARPSSASLWYAQRWFLSRCFSSAAKVSG